MSTRKTPSALTALALACALALPARSEEVAMAADSTKSDAIEATVRVPVSALGPLWWRCPRLISRARLQRPLSFHHCGRTGIAASIDGRKCDDVRNQVAKHGRIVSAG